MRESNPHLNINSQIATTNKTPRTESFFGLQEQFVQIWITCHYFPSARHIQSEIPWAWSVLCAIQHWKWGKIKVKDVIFSSLGSQNYDKGYNTLLRTMSWLAFFVPIAAWVGVPSSKKNGAIKPRVPMAKTMLRRCRVVAYTTQPLHRFLEKTPSKFFLIRVSIVQPLKSTWGFTLSLTRRWLRERNSFPQSQHYAL